MKRRDVGPAAAGFVGVGGPTVAFHLFQDRGEDVPGGGEFVGADEVAAVSRG